MIPTGMPNLPFDLSKTASAVRTFAIRAFRAMPQLRGRGRAAALVNQLTLRAGAEPIVLCEMFGGYRLQLDCRIFAHYHAAFSGHYDSPQIAALASFLRPGDIALDVGANIGFYSIPLALAARKSQARVVAVEPFPANVCWLRENLRLNALEDYVTVLPFAISDRTGTSTLVLAEDFLTGARVGNAAIDSDDLYDRQRFARVPVAVQTLDDVWPTLGPSGRLRVVKLDIEGREAQFLRGGSGTLSKHRPVLLIEINCWFYERRGLDYYKLIPGLLPADYVPAALRGCKLVRIDNLRECGQVNVFFLPAELLLDQLQRHRVAKSFAFATSKPIS